MIQKKYKFSTIFFILTIIELAQFLICNQIIFLYISLISFLAFIIFRLLNEKLNTFFSYFIITIIITYSLIPAIFYTLSPILINSNFGFKSLLSIQGVFISLIPITFIALIYNKLNFRTKINKFGFITTANFNLKLFSVIFLELLIEITNNAYYTKGMIGNENVNYNFLNNYSFFMFLKPISFVGILLQIIRYRYTCNKRDLRILVLMNLIIIICYLPSGSRESTFIILLATTLFYIRIFYNFLRINIFKSAFISLIFMFVVSFIGIWRVASVHVFNSNTFQERIQNVYKIYENRDDLVEIFETNSPLERFNEFNQIGDLIEFKTNNKIRPVYFENLQYIFLAFIPSIFRPINFDFNDGAILMSKYNLNEGVGGSVPISIHGDMYHRFGYYGFLLLFLVTIPYIIVDFLSFKNGYIGIIFAGMFFFQIIRLNTQSLLKHSIVLTRDFLFTYILAIIIYKIIIKYAKKENINN